MSEKSGVKGIYPILLVTMVVAISMTSLIVVDSFTRPLIEENQTRVFNEKLAEMFPEMADSEYLEAPDVHLLKDGDGGTIGYAFKVIGSGYGGNIEMLVGIESDRETIRGISVITHSETPGLGAKITEPGFQDQFRGENINTLALGMDGGNIDAISGATISASAVVDAVRETAMAKMQTLEEVP